MANVTNAQRRAFWAYVRRPGVGINRARRLMQKVTKGITSLRHPGMTPWKMNQVLETFSHYFEKPGKPAAEIKKGNDTILMRTSEQKQDIARLKQSLGWTDEKYHELCRLVIGRHEPLSQPEAARVIKEMQKILKVKR